MSTIKRIGVSIYPEVVVNKPASRMQQQILSDFAAGDILPFLKDRGATSIELRMLSGKLPPEDYLRFAEAVYRQGLTLTLHGVMPEDNPEAYIAQYHALLQLIFQQQGDCIFTVHSMETQMQTLTALQNLSAALKSYLHLRLSLENQRIKKPDRAHFSVHHVVQNALACGAGVTWDMGHYAYNIQNEIHAVPPQKLLKNVIHTHIHSLTADGNTHHHLTRSPVDGYIDALRDSGYEGIYNLELFSKTYPEDASPRKTLEDALCLLSTL